MNRQSELNPDMKRAITRLRFFPRWARSVRKRYFRLVHGDKPFVSQYYGAKFNIQWADHVMREIALQNFERHQIDYFIAACTRVKPDLFIDIGANSGLYSCILLKRNLVSYAILFEPDRRNVMQLKANLALNSIMSRTEIHEKAIGRTAARLKLRPGPENNRGLSKIVEKDDAAEDGYDVEVIRLDDVVTVSGRKIAIKIDIEGYEIEALSSMECLLRNNHGFVQIETTDRRDDVVNTMKRLGYIMVADFYHDLVFEKK